MFQDILKRRLPLCFPKTRIKFLPPEGLYPEGTVSQPTHGNALVFLGVSHETVERECGFLGECR